METRSRLGHSIGVLNGIVSINHLLGSSRRDHCTEQASGVGHPTALQVGPALDSRPHHLQRRHSYLVSDRAQFGDRPSYGHCFAALQTAQYPRPDLLAGREKNAATTCAEDMPASAPWPSWLSFQIERTTAAAAAACSQI